MIEIHAQRAPGVSSIVFHIMMFAGYNQRAVMERPLGYSTLQRNLLFSRHGTNCSSPFYHLEISLTLVLSWFCLGWPARFICGTQPAMPSVSYGRQVSANDCLRIRMLRASLADVAGTTKSRKYVF